VLLADPLGRRFHGALQLRLGEHGTISVINVVRLEHWIDGAVGGEVPSTWSASPAALDLAAILRRSRALAAVRARAVGWDLTSDDPVYLGVDGEQPALKAAADRTTGQAEWSAGAPLDGTISLDGAAPLTFAPDPGTPRKVTLAPSRPIAGAPVGLGPRAVALARTQLGVPYRWGGAAPGGFDCSGLVWWIYGRLGIRLPRVAEDQGTVGVPVADGDLMPGDAVFFADSSGYVHHEGIYIGGGQMIHAPQSGDVVTIERIDSGYYARQYAGARRFSPAS
jgi:cell wall-associated NlpC family hydrolase